ncbi:hypothetical protein AVEN_251756-1, partial [Araneus ventricosus]
GGDACEEENEGGDAYEEVNFFNIHISVGCLKQKFIV